MDPINKMLIGIAAALGLTAISAILWLLLTNAHLRTLLAETQAEATTCRLSNLQLAEAITHQNTAIAALQQQSAAREQRLKQAVAQAQQTAQNHERAAEKLRRLPLPADPCHGADKLLNDFLKARQ